MDRLNHDERALAWQALWNPSFVGIAIVNADFTFRSVNPQFCKLLGCTPAELIGRRFQEVTHPSVRTREEENAKMLKDGLIDFYVLPKSFQFSDGREKSVLLLVTRAPAENQGEFQFFVSNIMLAENADLHTETARKKSDLAPYCPPPIQKVVDFSIKYGKLLVAIGTMLAAIGVALVGAK